MINSSRTLAVLAMTVLALCAFTGSALGADVPPSRASCAACHGKDGNSAQAEIPRLAGMRAGYLYSQLLAFRSGARPSAVMAAIARSIPQDDLDDLARFYAAQSRDRDPPASTEAMALGRWIFLNGSRDGSVPACASCHVPGAGGAGRMGRGMRMGGMRMGGMMGMRRAPSLHGQHAAYLRQQLKAFADGSRPGTVMGPIAGAMSDAQIGAVSDYAAAQP